MSGITAGHGPIPVTVHREMAGALQTRAGRLIRQESVTLREKHQPRRALFDFAQGRLRITKATGGWASFV